MLPQLLFSDTQRAIGYFTNPDLPAGPFLYALFCKAQGIEPVPDHARAFQTHSGALGEGRTYHVLEYPWPRQEVVNLRDTVTGPLIPGGAVLAPFFSAILQTQTTGEVAYYTLGQRPMGGTTLRTVTREGMNANLGEGPVPELSAFLDVLRQKA